MERRNAKYFKSWSKELMSIYDDNVALKNTGCYAAIHVYVNTIRTEFIKKKMREMDSLFDYLFLQITGVGSYYSKLRVHKPTQFDIDVELNLPGIPRCEPEYPGWARLEFVQKSGDVAEIQKFVDVDGYFVPESVDDWFFAVFKKAADEIEKNDTSECHDGVIFYEYKRNGPVVTITATLKGTKVDIDIMPVYCQRGKNGEHIVHLSPKKRDDERTDLWRVTCTDKEKKMLEDSGCARKVIKFLKLMRDCRGSKLKKLASYYIKTVVLYMLDERKEYNWEEKNLGKLFNFALLKIRDYLGAEHIPYFPDKNENLLSKLKSR